MRISGFILACLLGTATAVVAEDAERAAAKETGPGANVQVTLTLGEVKLGPQRTYRLIARTGEPARMLVGWRTPIPTVRSPDGEGGEPITSYVYQNIGMTTRLQTNVLADGRFHVQGEIEISGAKPSELAGDVAGMPLIGTFQQDIDILLRAGEPLRIAEAPDPEGGQRYLEIKVSLLN